MLANLVKSLNTFNQVRYSYELTRKLCSLKENINARRAAKEEEDAIKIEENLFNQSSVKYEPVSAEKILSKNKNFKKQKSFKNTEKKQYKNQLEESFKNDLERSPQPYKPAVAFARKPRIERETSRVVNDNELGLEYVRLSLGDPRLATLLITARSKKRRDKYREIIIEGRRLIKEALDCELKLKSLIFSQKEQLGDIKDHVAEALKTNKTSQIFKVPQHDLKTWSTLTTPPGIMAIFERPDINNIMHRLEKLNVSPLPVTVVCDNIREPNNLGSIIRSCAALSCFQLVITKGCCDPWDSKALRGGCGGHFRVPIRDDIEWADVILTLPPEAADDCQVFIAENNLDKLSHETKVTEYSDVTQTGEHNVVIIGGESHGVSKQAYEFMKSVGPRGTCLNIPLAEGVDSLNVASALTLILYELRKTLIKNH